MNAPTLPTTHREVRLADQSGGTVGPEHFEVAETHLPTPNGTSQLLVCNRLMSVTAVMRSLMHHTPDLPMPAFELGEPLWGPAIGEVITAPPRSALNPGDLVEHSLGWREYAAPEADDARPVDLRTLPTLDAHLSQGFTAWLGVTRGARVRAGDTVFITGAAGGVGSLAGQFARLHGAAQVIGSTSSPQKAERLEKELGYDAVVLRDSETPIADQLRRAAPKGIDAVFDNVGGEQLSSALSLANVGARVAVVGSLSAQLDGTFASLTEIDTGALVTRRVTLRGIAGMDHLDALGEWTEEFGRALRTGEITVPHTRFTGVDQAPRALCELLAGHHVGTVLVEL